MRLDSHQHFWNYDEQQYPWIPKGSPLHRDWLPDDLAPLLAGANLDGCIAVQARQTLEETRWLLMLADQAPIIKGVVGWVDLRSGNVGEDLAQLTTNSKLVGVRHVVQDEPDESFMLQPEFGRGIGQLQPFGLAYDLLIYPKQLPAAIALVKRFPEQRFVLDHLAKPCIKERVLSPWREQICELAQSPRVHCKLSGMVTEANHTTWKFEDFVPYLDAAFEAFGEDRVMFGSDWPVCLLAASYPRAFDILDRYLGNAPSAREKVLGMNAAKFYGAFA
ncbi:MAG: amidohydrolase family protein [Verrucomicrobiota bacterium]|nr:amidohydrolase family protein [Verrucomicrobiota bacterium]